MEAPRLIAFDVDETLAESFQPPKAGMVERLEKLLLRVPVAIVSGAGFDRLLENFLTPLQNASARVSQLYIFPNSASQAFTWKGAWEEEYNLSFSEEERARIKEVLSALEEKFPLVHDVERFGERIADRQSQIAYTVVGLDAPQQVKMSWDPDAAKRRVVKEYLEKQLPGLDIRTGGASTIDITRPGVNKAYGIRWLSKLTNIPPNEMLYIGDALYEGGNDAVVKETGIQTRQVAGPAETERVIDELLATLNS